MCLSTLIRLSIYRWIVWQVSSCCKYFCSLLLSIQSLLFFCCSVASCNSSHWGARWSRTFLASCNFAAPTSSFPYLSSKASNILSLVSVSPFVLETLMVLLLFPILMNQSLSALGRKTSHISWHMSTLEAWIWLYFRISFTLLVALTLDTLSCLFVKNWASEVLLCDFQCVAASHTHVLQAWPL